MTFTVAIVGRTNVGKSTLFNRLVGKKLAIVDDKPGVTRDVRQGKGRIADLSFRILDTAGFENASKESLEARMQEQTLLALKEVDLVFFVIDSRAGVMPLDEQFSQVLRVNNIPTLLLANKCEGKAGQGGLLESYRLGFDNPIPVSAAHGEGLLDLYQALLPYIEVYERGKTADLEVTDDSHPIQIAIVGRPNVGKSTLINALIGDQKQLTGPEAGITRDAISFPLTWNERQLRLIDTAGLRKHSRVIEKLEKLSTNDTFRSIRYAQVVVLLLDSQNLLEKQDLTIARQVIEEGRALIIAVNKWDLVKNPQATRRTLQDRLQTSLAQVRGLPIITLSAKTGKNVDSILPTVLEIYNYWNIRIPTSSLNNWLSEMLEIHPPPLVRGRRIKIRYVTQAKARPPTFIFFCSLPEDLPDSYVRYLINGLRERFGIIGTPIRAALRKRQNPFETKKK